MGFGLLGSDVAYYAAVCNLAYFGYLMLANKKHVLVPPIFWITCKRRPISFANALFHFGLLGPFIKGLYSWGFTVSGHITAFIRTGCIFTSPVVLLVYDQYYPVFCTDYVGTARLGGLSGSTVAMLLGSRAWPCILLAMV